MKENSSLTQDEFLGVSQDSAFEKCFFHPFCVYNEIVFLRLFKQKGGFYE
jgi:hypothetical protein